MQQFIAWYIKYFLQEKFEYTKEVTRSRKSKNRQSNCPKENWQKYKQWSILHIEQSEPWKLTPSKKKPIYKTYI